jgi:LysM repeat protein
MYNRNLYLGAAIILASLLIGTERALAVSYTKKTALTPQEQHYISQTRTYRVRLGDTLSGIAYRYRMSLRTLLEYNPHLRSRPNLIYVGETVSLGGGYTSPVTDTSQSPTQTRQTRGATYKVRAGDSLSTIAYKNGLSVSQLLQYNPHLYSRINEIYVGETINLGRISSQQPSTSTISSQTPSTSTTSSQQPSTPTTSSQPQTSSGERQQRQSIVFSGLPTERRPGTAHIAAKRGPGEFCTKKPDEQMRSLLPENNLGYTFDDYPTFFWYLPELQSQSIPIKFILREVERTEVNGKPKETSQSVYETQLRLDQPGIISYALPPDSTPLEEGKEYLWQVRVNCPQNTIMWVEGRIKRISTNDPELITVLENASPKDYPAIFANRGIWYDALKMISGQLQGAGNDPILWEGWTNALKQMGFNDLNGVPIQYIEPNWES